MDKEYTVEYLPLFEQDVREITDYIADVLRNSAAAGRLCRRFLLPEVTRFAQPSMRYESSTACGSYYKNIFKEKSIMPKTTIAGNSYVITSDVSMADLEAVKKYRPAALTLADEETKETYFRVGIGNSSSVTDHGISFSGVTNDDTKKATATMPIPADAVQDGDAKEYVLDKAGVALANLAKVEAGIATALKDIKTERDTIAANIKVSV